VLPDTADKLVCFALAGQEFAAPIRAVKETLPMRPVTRLFLVPPFVAGLINLRGEVVAVLDLARLLGLPVVDGGRASRRATLEGSIVILRPSASAGPRAQGRAAAGLIVDRLTGVRDVSASALGAPPPTLSSESAAYLRGVASVGDPPAPLLILDPERVLGSDRLRPFRRTRGAAA
jgi:purine-binding chemotaxis protein CheW